MLDEEARWIGNFIKTVEPRRIFPMLNIGSSTEEFRKKTQPWIHSQIFAPVLKNGFSIVHMDIKKAPGVDIVGDLNDNNFLEQLMKMNFKSVLCSNLLEHVHGVERISVAIESVVASKGIIIATCPYAYPYHPDPIDTNYRPSPAELAGLFRNSKIIISEVVDCDTHLKNIVKNSHSLILTFLRLALPFYKPRGWWQLLCFQRWIFRRFLVSCVVLEKK